MAGETGKKNNNAALTERRKSRPVGLDEETFNRMFHIQKKKVSREEVEYRRKSNDLTHEPG